MNRYGQNHNKNTDGDDMKRVFEGLAVTAAVLAAPAQAGPLDADLWIGLAGAEDGFLIDEETGEAWLTGQCLKPIAKAVKSGNVWTSHTVELVSVGRAKALLDQTFTLDVTAGAPSIAVLNADRGGERCFESSQALLGAGADRESFEV